MPKRILVFADDTGNEGGLLPDESRTNVYKLYRGTRSGPDSPIDPAEQIAFYVPGVGTPMPGHNPAGHRLKAVADQAIGAGVKARIRQCYRAIIGSWQPGDTIYLFGFSRGAYTARCVAHLLERFGIPARGKVSLDPRQLDRVAKQAVNATYLLGFLIPSDSYRQQRIDAFRRSRCRVNPDAGRRRGLPARRADRRHPGGAARPAYELVAVAGSFQHRTRKSVADAIRASGVAGSSRLELSRYEATILMAVAYLQPITRAELGAVIGVPVSRDTIAAIRSDGFIASGPRAPLPGAPYTYVTTPAFLSAFGFDTLRDLPDIEALEDAGLLSRSELLEGEMPDFGKDEDYAPAEEAAETESYVHDPGYSVPS